MTDTQTTAEKWLTLAEVAAMHKASIKTVRRWIAAGILPAYRVGPRMLRVRPADAEVQRPVPAVGNLR